MPGQVKCVGDQTCLLHEEVSNLESHLTEKTAKVEALALDVGELEAQVKTANEEAAGIRIRYDRLFSPIFAKPWGDLNSFLKSTNIL